jgi:hypothetical protein
MLIMLFKLSGPVKFEMPLCKWIDTTAVKIGDQKGMFIILSGERERERLLSSLLSGGSSSWRRWKSGGGRWKGWCNINLDRIWGNRTRAVPIKYRSRSDQEKRQR